MITTAPPKKLFHVVEDIETPVLNLAAILDTVSAYLCRFMAFSSDAQPIALALWVAHAWAIKAFDYTPYLHIQSPEKRCGKSRLLDCLGLLVPKPWQVVSPSEAVLFRKIEADEPTLFLDEVDTIFTNGKDDGKEAQRSLLNSGFERRSKVPRCVGPTMEVKEFSVFCAKALAGIGRLPDTVSDRCVEIRLVRRTSDEAIEKFRKRDADAIAVPIRDALSQWAEQEQTISELRASRPDMPPNFGDRQADICEPLFAIAQMAGGDWPARAARSLDALISGSEDDDSLSIKLLLALQTIFEAEKADRMPTEALLIALIAIEDDAPWAHWWENDMKSGNTRGPAARLARYLKPFGIHSRAIRLPDNSTPRGFLLEDFKDVWKRYCPPKTA